MNSASGPADRRRERIEETVVELLSRPSTIGGLTSTEIRQALAADGVHQSPEQVIWALEALLIAKRIRHHCPHPALPPRWRAAADQ